MAGNSKRTAPRAAVGLRVKLRYPDLESFISKFATNISRGGMFLASRNPKPSGTILQFELRLADDTPAIAGVGEVRWVREYSKDTPTIPHGMGVQFFELSPDSEARIAELVAERIRRGLPVSEDIPHAPEGARPLRARKQEVADSAPLRDDEQTQIASTTAGSAPTVHPIEIAPIAAELMGFSAHLASERGPVRTASARLRQAPATLPENANPYADLEVHDAAEMKASSVEAATPVDPIDISQKALRSALKKARALAGDDSNSDAMLSQLMKAPSVPTYTIDEASDALAKRFKTKPPAGKKTQQSDSPDSDPPKAADSSNPIDD